jgi:phospholipase/carboxylesterase
VSSLAHFGAPRERARVVALLLHGRDHDPDMMHELVVKPLALDTVAYIAPAAADRSWYPAGFMAPTADNEPKLGDALEQVARLAGELARPHVVIGFSQGACLACEHVYRRRNAATALIAFTGGLIGPPGTTWRRGDDLRGMPVLISGSVADPWVPIGRMRDTADAIAQLGARVTTQFYAGDGHGVSDDEIALARALIAGPGV